MFTHLYLYGAFAHLCELLKAKRVPDQKILVRRELFWARDEPFSERELYCLHGGAYVCAMTSSSDPCCALILSRFDLRLLRALADPIRLDIIARLADMPEGASVTGLTGCCGIDFSGVSRHLKTLREAGIVSAEKSGRETRYRLRRTDVAQQLSAMAEALTH
jgi:ArsR family transcriptional regulator